MYLYWKLPVADFASNPQNRWPGSKFLQKAKFFSLNWSLVDLVSIVNKNHRVDADQDAWKLWHCATPQSFEAIDKAPVRRQNIQRKLHSSPVLQAAGFYECLTQPEGSLGSLQVSQNGSKLLKVMHRNRINHLQFIGILAFSTAEPQKNRSPQAFLKVFACSSHVTKMVPFWIPL